MYSTVSDYSNAIGAFDSNISVTIGKSATSRTNAVTNLVNLATSNGFAGINLDMEAVGHQLFECDTGEATFVPAIAEGVVERPALSEYSTPFAQAVCRSADWLAAMGDDDVN